MELLRLRRRVELARRGHKLLKDKLDGLVQRFNSIKNEYLKLQDQLEPLLGKVFSKAVFASALSAISPESNPAAGIGVESTSQNIMGIRIPVYRIKGEARTMPASLSTTVEQSEAVSGFSNLLPDLVKLASSSQALRQMAKSIIETRRRVNALEYVLIPELDRNVKLIRMQLSERERSTQVVLLKLSEQREE
jgi:V/A-type H+-transporting ATPase subunit D